MNGASIGKWVVDKVVRARRGQGVRVESMSTGERTGAEAMPSYVVGIGASAGGLEALERLFKAMPLDTGMAFVVIQHLSPDF